MPQKSSELSDSMRAAFIECFREGRDVTFLDTFSAEATRLNYYCSVLWGEIVKTFRGE